MQKSVKNTHRFLFMRFRSYILKLRNEDTLKFKVYEQRPEESSIHFVLLVFSFLTIIIVFARKRSDVPVFFSCSSRNIKSTESKEGQRVSLARVLKCLQFPYKVQTQYMPLRNVTKLSSFNPHTSTHIVYLILEILFLLH